MGKEAQVVARFFAIVPKRYLLRVTIVVVILSAISLMFIPSIGKRTPPGSAVIRQVQLRQLTMAVLNYVEDFDGYAPTPEAWHEVMDPWIGISADDPIYGVTGRNWYYMLPSPWPDGRLPDDLDRVSLASIPLFYENPILQPNRTSVGFWDGSVRALDDAEFDLVVDVTKGVSLGITNP
jgi:hypothetical protein